MSDLQSFQNTFKNFIAISIFEVQPRWNNDIVNTP